MNNEELIKQLQDELEQTKQELNLTKEHLKKYTAPSCKKQYYEINKEEIKKGGEKTPRMFFTFFKGRRTNYN